MRGTLLIMLVWAQGLSWTSDLQATFEQAKKTKKPLWIMVSSEGCAPCVWIEKHLLPQKWFDSLIRTAFIPVKIYPSAGPEQTFAEKHRVRMYPTFLYAWPNGEVFYRSEGAMIGEGPKDPEVRAFWEKQVREALFYNRELPSLRRRFERGDRTPAVIRPYFLWALAVGDSATLHTAWEAYLRVYPSVSQAWFYEPKAYQALIRAAWKLPRVRSYALSVADSLKPHLTPVEWRRFYRNFLRWELENYLLRREAVSNGLLSAAESTLTYARGLGRRFPFVERMALNQAVTRLFQAESAQYQEAAFAYAVQYYALAKSTAPLDADEREEVASALGAQAWGAYRAFSQPDHLWIAILWAKEALAYEPEDWTLWDLLGSLYHKLQRKAEAIEALSKAISLAKAQGEPEEIYQETEALLQEVQEAD